MCVCGCAVLILTMTDCHYSLFPRLRAEALGASQDSKDEGGEDVCESLNPTQIIQTPSI